MRLSGGIQAAIPLGGSDYRQTAIVEGVVPVHLYIRARGRLGRGPEIGGCRQALPRHMMCVMRTTPTTKGGKADE